MSIAYGFCLGDESTVYTAEDFSAAFRAIVGDGVTHYGQRFSVLPNGFTLVVGTGFGFADGRWVTSDEPMRLTVKPPDGREDRTDALCLRVDYGGRKASVEILTGVDADAILADPSILHQGESFLVVLYFIRVRRGATYIDASDITDARENPVLCGDIQTLARLTAGTHRVYCYLTDGLDKEISALEDAADAIEEKADQKIHALELEINNAGAANTLGTLETARREPMPDGEWLLCDGSAVPKGYASLSAMVDGVLPNISRMGDRYTTWIYAGPRDYAPVAFIPAGSDGLITKDGYRFVS